MEKLGNSLLNWAVFLKFNDPLGSEVLTWRKSFMTSVCLQAFHTGIASCWDFLTRSLIVVRAAFAIEILCSVSKYSLLYGVVFFHM